MKQPSLYLRQPKNLVLIENSGNYSFLKSRIDTFIITSNIDEAVTLEEYNRHPKQLLLQIEKQCKIYYAAFPMHYYLELRESTIINPNPKRITLVPHRVKDFLK